MKFIAEPNSKVPSEFYDEIKKVSLPYIEHLNKIKESKSYDYPESSINLLDDGSLIDSIKNIFKNKNTKDLKYIFICGIGGSNLGAKAIYDANFLFKNNILNNIPKVIFLDSINPQQADCLEHATKTIDSLNDFILICITKSGTTIETVTNLEVITNYLIKKFNIGDVFDRTICITSKNSLLWERANEKGISTISIPEKVPGRFSVFSAVGMLPLLFTGLKVEELLEKAKLTRDWCLNTDLNDNPAFASAVFLYYHLKQGKTISNSFFFNTELESLGKWYRQLLGESLSKESKNKDIPNSITPIVSIGSTDLHSMAQLFFGGHKDKTTTFIKMNYSDSHYYLDNNIYKLVDNIEGKTLEEITKIIYEGTKNAYIKDELPFIEITLDGCIDIASFMQFKMLEIMILANILGEDAFTQPHVEKYKSEVYKILNNDV